MIRLLVRAGADASVRSIGEHKETAAERARRCGHKAIAVELEREVAAMVEPVE